MESLDLIDINDQNVQDFLNLSKKKSLIALLIAVNEIAHKQDLIFRKQELDEINIEGLCSIVCQTGVPPKFQDDVPVNPKPLHPILQAALKNENNEIT